MHFGYISFSLGNTIFHCWFSNRPVTFCSLYSLLSGRGLLFIGFVYLKSTMLLSVNMPLDYNIYMLFIIM